MWASAPTAVGRSTSVERGWSCVARHIRRIDPCIWSGQRQRRGRRDDPTFHAPCKIHQPCGTHPNNLKRAGRAKGFLNRRFKRRFLHTFCRCWQKVCRRRPLPRSTGHRGRRPLHTLEEVRRSIDGPMWASAPTEFTKSRGARLPRNHSTITLPAFFSARPA